MNAQKYFHQQFQIARNIVKKYHRFDFSEMAFGIIAAPSQKAIGEVSGGFNSKTNKVVIYFNRDLPIRDNQPVKSLHGLKIKLFPSSLISVIHELFESIYSNSTYKNHPRFTTVFETGSYSPGHSFAVQKELETLDLMLQQKLFPRFERDLILRRNIRKQEVNEFYKF